MNEQDIDLEGNGEGYSGTFRWKQNKKLYSFPKPNTNNKLLNVNRAWMEYFLSRNDCYICT